MNRAPINLRRSPARAILTRFVLGCVVAAGVHLAVEAQTPNIATLQKQAKEGNAEAQFELAKAYLLGTGGVPQDSKQGVEWLQKAAKLDHPGAQLALAKMYLDGRERNIPKDPRKGLELLQKSADHGFAPAQHDLAVLYLNGDVETGIPMKPHEAAAWFRKAARQPGSLQSQASLQDMLKKRLITAQEANWRGPEPTKEAEKGRPTEADKGKPAPFSVAEIETGLKSWITTRRMARLVQQFGVDFKLSDATRKRLADAGADPDLLQIISASKRSL